MKITKRIAKEVHNEKQKSFDEGKIIGRQEAMKETQEKVEKLKYELSMNLTLSKTPLNTSWQIIDKIFKETK